MPLLVAVAVFLLLLLVVVVMVPAPHVHGAVGYRRAAARKPDAGGDHQQVTWVGLPAPSTCAAASHIHPRRGAGHRARAAAHGPWPAARCGGWLRCGGRCRRGGGCRRGHQDEVVCAGAGQWLAPAHRQDQRPVRLHTHAGGVLACSRRRKSRRSSRRRQWAQQFACRDGAGGRRNVLTAAAHAHTQTWRHLPPANSF